MEDQGRPAPVAGRGDARPGGSSPRPTTCCSSPTSAGWPCSCPGWPPGRTRPSISGRSTSSPSRTAGSRWSWSLADPDRRGGRGARAGRRRPGRPGAGRRRLPGDRGPDLPGAWSTTSGTPGTSQPSTPGVLRMYTRKVGGGPDVAGAVGRRGPSSPTRPCGRPGGRPAGSKPSRCTGCGPPTLPCWRSRPCWSSVTLARLTGETLGKTAYVLSVCGLYSGLILALSYRQGGLVVVLWRRRRRCSTRSSTWRW